MPIHATAEMLQAAASQLPELPAVRAERLQADYGLTADRAQELAFRRELGDYFERALAAAPAAGNGDSGESEPRFAVGGSSATAVELANWIPQLVERIGSDQDPAQSKVAPERLAELASMVLAKAVSRDAAREVLSRMVSDGGFPAEIVAREGLGALGGDDDDDQLRLIVERAIAADPDAAAKVHAGNMKAVGPLVGFVMRETKGRADGGEVTRLIRELVGS